MELGRRTSPEHVTNQNRTTEHDRYTRHCKRQPSRLVFAAVSPFEITSVVIAALAVFVNLGALIFLAKQVQQGVDATRQADQNRQLEWARNKRESSLQFYMSTVESRESYKTALPSDRDTKAIAELIEDSETNADSHNRIRLYINYMEMVSAGVNSGVLDLDVIDRLMNIVPAWNNYAPWILRQRKTFGAPGLSIEFERFANLLATRDKLRCSARADAPEYPIVEEAAL